MPADYQNCNLFPIFLSLLHFSLCQEQNASYYFVEKSDGEIPPYAVVAGNDTDGSPVYAGRAIHGITSEECSRLSHEKGKYPHQMELFPAKVVPSRKGAYVGTAGYEYFKSTYDVLCSPNNSIAWETASYMVIPKNAIVMGESLSGAKLYMGRGMYQGCMTPGKIYTGYPFLYILFSGKEIQCNEFEVLVYL